MHPETLRPHLDEHGLLRQGALEPPDAREAYTVFAQREDARFEPEAWSRHAERFFRAKLGLTADKRYGHGVPVVDAAGIVLAPAVPFRDGGGPSVRLVFARPAEPTDHDAADAADTLRGFSGLSALARRCRYVYLIRQELEPRAPPGSDRASLLLAAILASIVLGPIVTPMGGEIFGVKGAREKLGL